MTPEDNKATHPDRQYLSEGTQYVAFGGPTFEIVRFVRDAPAGGVAVVTWVDREGHPSHEHERPNPIVSQEKLQPFVDEYGDQGGIVTSEGIVRQLKL